MGSPEPPQGKSSVFEKQWKKLIKIISSRSDFHDNLLDQLEILCDLYQEYHELSLDIKENGYSIVTEGRYGTQVKKRIEVEQKNKALSEIRMYSKMLGIVSVGGEIQNNNYEEEWE